MTNSTSAELLRRYVDGDSRAAQEIFDRYLQRLIALARSRLAPKLRSRLDPEDVVQSAYRSFFSHARTEDFVLQRAGDLWRLLAAITLNKLRKQVERHTAARRDLGREAAAGDLAMHELAATEPSPDEAAELVEQLQQLMAACGADERRVVEMRLAGAEHEEIAAAIHRSPRTVRRLLQQVRDRLERQLQRELTDNGLPTGPAQHDDAPVAGVSDPRAPLSHEDFVLQRHVGTGGMGRVYRAVQRSLGRTVAIKALRKLRQHDRAAVDRFLQEARILARLRHPHIVGVHGLGRFPGGGYFMVLDWIEGPNLAEHLESGGLDQGAAIRIAITIAEAVDYAHRRHIIHCDLKPANVLLDEAGTPHVTDFGFAQLLPGSSEDDGPKLPPGGTRAFMAPEQLDAGVGDIGPATDVYAFGQILQLLLAGETRRTNHKLRELVDRCMQPSPRCRPQSLASVADHLLAGQSGGV